MTVVKNQERPASCKGKNQFCVRVFILESRDYHTFSNSQEGHSACYRSKALLPLKTEVTPGRSAESTVCKRGKTTQAAPDAPQEIQRLHGHQVYWHPSNAMGQWKEDEVTGNRNSRAVFIEGLAPYRMLGHLLSTV